MSESCPECAQRSARLSEHERKVLAINPTAQLIEGRGGRVWIASRTHIQLSDVCSLGSYWDRMADAWESAAKRLGIAEL